MLRMILRRLMLGAITVGLVSLIIFSAVEALPGDAELRMPVRAAGAHGLGGALVFVSRLALAAGEPIEEGMRAVGLWARVDVACQSRRWAHARRVWTVAAHARRRVRAERRPLPWRRLRWPAHLCVSALATTCLGWAVAHAPGHATTLAHTHARSHTHSLTH